MVDNFMSAGTNGDADDELPAPYGTGPKNRTTEEHHRSDYGYADDVHYGSDSAASCSLGFTGRMSFAQATLEVSKSMLAPESLVIDEDPRVFFSMRMTF